MKKLAVLISGRGSNLKSIINESKKPNCLYIINVVIADNDCIGLQYAKDENIPIRIVNYNSVPSREHAEGIIDGVLQLYDIDLVVLAGYMKLLTSYIVSRWKDKIINIHPALSPAFTGLHTHERAIERGVKYHGCTVHYVDAGMDTGPIIAQRVVPVLTSDTASTLANKVLEQEHQILPLVIEGIASGDILIIDNEVIYRNNTLGNL
ncbi:MAG: phosphoribosylglycinamide formyltransferase [Richelia sp. RM2_1_2]|nr:phosphoribosylglycinamide formyltransferase [Richelia sp. RM2_1_2]